MAKRFLVDTDVIIEYLRGRDQAVQYLESLEGTLHVSVVTAAELYSGVRDNEQEALEQFLNAFDVVAVDISLARSVGLCRRSYQLRVLPERPRGVPARGTLVICVCASMRIGT